MVVTVAKKYTIKTDLTYLEQGLKITKIQMKKNLNYLVFYKNIVLVLFNPIKFFLVILKKIKLTSFKL